MSLTPLINKPESSKGFAIFMISSISSLEIIKVINADPNILLRIAASVADAVAVNPDDIKTLLANGLRTFHYVQCINVHYVHFTRYLDFQ